MIATAPTVAPSQRRDMGAAPAAPGPSVLALGHTPILWAERPQADRLAIAYQRGDREALEPLYESLRPLITFELRMAAARARRLGLPLPLEHADLQQQAWVALAHLATLWRPGLGAFGAYVRGSLGWSLSRHVKAQSQAHASRGVTVRSLPHAVAAELAAQQVGEDGRDFAERIAWAELLGALPDRQRSMLLLTAVGGLTIAEAARRMGTSISAAQRILGQARHVAARWQATGELPAPPSTRGRDAARLLRALAADPESPYRIPGRAPACAASGLSQRQYGHAVDALVAAGVVVGRSGRRPGRLDYAAASAWLGETLVPPPEDAPPPPPVLVREPGAIRLGWRPRPQPKAPPPPPRRPAAAPLPPCTLGHDAGLDALRSAFGIALFRAGRTAGGVQMYLYAIARYRAWLAATGRPDTAASLDGPTIEAFRAHLAAEGRRDQTVRSHVCVVRAWAAWARGE